jgi:hypothetical protein
VFRFVVCLSLTIYLCAAFAGAQSATQVPSSSHVFLIVEENASYSTVTNKTDANNYMPWLIGEGTTFGHATNYVTDSSGSLLDYLWLSSGSCHGDSSITPVDCTLPPGTHSFGCTGGSCVSPITDDNIYREMTASGISWKEYEESIPSVGYMGVSVFPYDTHHNPAMWYSDVINSTALQQHIVGFDQFQADLANNQLPRYSIVIPNDNDDAHDMSPAVADTWLKNNIAPLLQQSFFQPCGDGLLIITFDNGDGDGAGQVYTALIGPKVMSGVASSTAYKHENALRTILDALGITTRPGAAATASPMVDFFITPAPCPVLAPSPLTFSSEVLQVPVTSTVQITNGGDAAMNVNSIAASGDFTETDNCGSSVGARGSCTVAVKFKPTAVGLRTGTLTVNDSATGSPHTVSLSGTGVQLGLTQSSLAFAKQLVNTTSTAQSVTVTNTGSTNLTISGVNASAGYDEDDNCGTLAPNGTCTVNISFVPSTSGPENGTVTVSYGGTSSVINTTGTGVNLGLAPPPTPFPNQLVGTHSTAQTVTVTNTSSSSITISSVIASAGFGETDNCGTLAANATCSVNISFTPGAAGAQNGTVSVQYGGTQSIINVSGTAVNLGLSSGSLSFSNQLVGTTSSSQPFTVTNTGSSGITISSVAASTGFSQTNNCGALATNASCTVNVSFGPNSTGLQNGSVTLQYGGTQTVVNLSGTGTDFSVGAQSGSPSSVSITPGQTASFNLSVSGSAGFSGTVNLACSGAPPLSTCSLSAPSLTVNGTPATFTASIATTKGSNAVPVFQFRQPPPTLFLVVLTAVLGLLATFTRLPIRIRYAGMFAFLGSLLVLVAGCGGGGGSMGPPVVQGTPAGVYTVVVTASSGSVNRSFNLSVNVQ